MYRRDDGWQPTHRHYKGNLYRLISKATHSETGEVMAVYDNAEGRVWVRPLAMFEQRLGDGSARFDPLPIAPTDGTDPAQ
ncbi:hypothetical protein A6A04_13260 [Paramagnetospirillum marisnigri]|uniref:DUF1653 domain-containing protein n=1 Tax=Paramagnetospirillum marisnigri TaxID=1285242 RepID=A0A178MXB8_9PROT|nr:hypothetical protein A6A04_13260 [Paramagnetospirillum marisnigri]